MDIVEKFKIQHKKRTIYLLIAILFLIPALVISYKDIVLSFSPIRSDYVVLIMKSISLIFCFLAYYQSFCPSCKKLAGSGWIINKCKKCGVKLT